MQIIDNTNSHFGTLRYSLIKPVLHMVVTIAEHASDVAPNRILRLSIHRLQIFLAKYEYLRSLQLCEDQGDREKTCLQPCACDPYSGDQVFPMAQFLMSSCIAIR